MSEKKRFLLENGYYVSTPSGNSMRPFIKGGLDVVTVVPLEAPPRLFDAVLYYRKNGEHVIHRIVCKRRDGYLIRGDNCYYTEKVSAENVIGVVHTVLRGARTINARTDGTYRFSIAVWHIIYPVRFIVHGAVRCFVKLKRKMFGGKHKHEKNT